MDFSKKRIEVPSPINSPQKKQPKLFTDDGLEAYQTMYRARPKPPKPMCLDTFEELTLRRMKLLSKLFEIDGMSSQDCTEKSQDAMDNPLFKFSDDQDVISHYALRLGLCLTERWRSWFVKYEVLLFRLRMRKATARKQKSVLEKNRIPVEEVTDDLLGPELAKELKVLADQDDKNEPVLTYYKVPFQRVLKLAASRRVLIRGGQAYVPHKFVMQLVEAAYRAHLMGEMNRTVKARASLEPAERDRILAFLDHVVENLNMEGRTEVDISDPSQRVNWRQIHEVAPLHFPLCMKVMDERLRDDHHLKFNARWQYGLFVKGLGLKLDEALDFWKSEMTQTSKKVTLETWNKSRYAYNIRHYFGAEGKRTSYSTQGCVKIIMGPPPGGEAVHGCPFKHFPEAQLRKELARARPLQAQGKKEAAMFQAKIELGPSQIDSVVTKAAGGFYTAACTQYFLMTHPGHLEESVFHNPLQYFRASVAHADVPTDAPTDAPQSAPAPPIVISAPVPTPMEEG